MHVVRILLDGLNGWDVSLVIILREDEYLFACYHKTCLPVIRTKIGQSTKNWTEKLYRIQV
jgi:hypothetical protein